MYEGHKGKWGKTQYIKVSIFYPKYCIYVTGCAGILDELVGSHTKVVIYPAYTICCERL